MKQRRKLKAAVIGCGNIGAEEKNYSREVRPGTHAGAFSANRSVTLAALSDVDPKKLYKAGKNFPQARLYSDAAEMLSVERPDIVSVATPTKFHKENVLLLASMRCPVILCEKPLAYSVPDARAMVAACRKSGSRLFVNHQRRFDGLLSEWARRTRRGLLGNIEQGNAYYCNGLVNNGTHLVDLMRMFLGDPVSVWGKYDRATSSKQGDPNVNGVLFFKNGPMVAIQSLSKNTDYFGMELFGSKGRLEITDLGFRINYQPKIKSKKYAGYFEFSPRLTSAGRPRSMMSEAIDYVVDFALGKNKPRGTGEDGVAALKILSALKQSAEAGGKEVRIK